jgi:hypothetical protein
MKILKVFIIFSVHVFVTVVAEKPEDVVTIYLYIDICTVLFSTRFGL